ncbi:MAG: hypothetical protein IJZ19_06105 [Lentisphaeria bacterium]|nr:hypothetical protein [Lentisphaeria bacterium]
MAKSDFLKDAKEAYKKRFPKKDWDSLSDSTKKKYYYEAMRLYEQRTGKPAYTQVSGSVSFSNEREILLPPTGKFNIERVYYEKGSDGKNTRQIVEVTYGI